MGRAVLLWQSIARRPALAAAGLSVVLTLTTAHYGPRAVGGADEYGYASQAELWLKGRLTIDQSFVRQVPWPFAERSFTPLGYHPHPNDRGIIVPTYSPGLPMLLAVAKLVGGQDAMFFVVPITAGLLAFFTFLIGHRLGSSAAGLAAAWLVATSPTVLFMTTATMSDVPVASAWAWAFAMLLRGRVSSALAAGALSSIAILIRPNLAPLAGVLALRYALLMRTKDQRRSAALQLAAYLVALAPGVVCVAVLNDRLHGSPFTSGYGALSELFAVERIPANLQLYLAWLAESHTPIALLGLLAVFVPLRRIRLPLQTNDLSIVIALFVGFLWTLYCAWLIFDVWWFTRFMLSSWPFIMLALASIVVAIYAPGPRLVRVLVVVAVIALGVYQFHFAREWHVFGTRDGRRRFVAAARLVRSVTDRNSVVLSKDHNGSIRYYGGRMTIDYAWMPRGASLDSALQWLKSHDVSAYLAVEEWELPEVRRRFAGSDAVRALDAPPVAIYEHPGRMLVIALTDPRPPEAKPVVEKDTDIGSRAAPPLPLGRLVFRD